MKQSTEWLRMKELCNNNNNTSAHARAKKKWKEKETKLVDNKWKMCRAIEKHSGDGDKQLVGRLAR